VFDGQVEQRERDTVDGVVRGGVGSPQLRTVSIVVLVRIRKRTNRKEK